MGGKVDVWIPALEKFATEAQRILPAPAIDREPIKECGGMPECAALAGADQFVTDALKSFLEKAGPGVQLFGVMAGKSASAYRAAGEAAQSAVLAPPSPPPQTETGPAVVPPDIPYLGNPSGPLV
ncbi:hypothetical protein DL991_24760 [Amycolatopsis sp. WAC 01375]|uniref:hypothetical protein n=1 Tax=Amycolatopsis sp. WAC 01375 TaxID=2203194 RepID=UPI000F77541F|nr:hypothetical protein [Amycolatopsis sp. WAC 01375]RSM76431.1 hypothetical protein DL991_24760 [Amycolatopsis sp. WAC 01375]